MSAQVPIEVRVRQIMPIIMGSFDKNPSRGNKRLSAKARAAKRVAEAKGEAQQQTPPRLRDGKKYPPANL